MSDNVVVSRHAVARFKQRFRYKIHSDMLNTSGINHMVRKFLTDAIRCDLQLRNQVGKYNSMCIKHGGVVEYYTYSDIIFACIRERGRLVVRTVYHNEQNTFPWDSIKA